jgi:hypothetical protein
MTTPIRFKHVAMPFIALPSDANFSLSFDVGVGYDPSTVDSWRVSVSRRSRGATPVWVSDLVDVTGQIVSFDFPSDTVSDDDVDVTLADLIDIKDCRWSISALDVDGVALWVVQGDVTFVDNLDAAGATAAVGSALSIQLDETTTISLTISTGDAGAAGASSYMYVAYASDASGTDFTLVPDVTSTYVAFLSSDTEIVTPVALDFAGLWVAISGASGTVTSVAVSGSDGIEVDSGSPVTSSGTIALGINAATLSTHLSLGTAATTAATAYATAAQGALADSATQPGDLATVATTGAYSDLTGTPTVPTTLIELDTTVTGAELNAVKSKVDGIEAGADVTDTTNVAAAGALMDSEVTNLAQVKAFSSADYATSAQGALADSAIQPGDDAADLGSSAATDGYVLTADGAGGAAWEVAAGGGGSGTVTSIAVSGSDGIEIDSGSPVTSSGTIALGINAATLSTHLSLGTAATTAATAYATAAQGTDERVPTAAGLTSKFGTNKATIADGDKIAIFDSAATDSPKHSLFSLIKSTLKTYFDTLYAAALGPDDNYVTDAEKTAIGNTSGINTGDQTNITGNAATVTTNANLTGHVTSVGNAAVLGSFTVSQLSTALSDATISGNNSGDQDLSGYSLTSHAHAGTYQPLDAQLTDLAGLSYTGNALKVVQVNAGETAFELATASGIHIPAIIEETTTTRTLALTDSHDFIHATNASGCAITVPPQTDVTWADGTIIYGDQGAAGAVTIVAGAGVTIDCADTLVTDGQHSAWALIRKASDVWLLTGRLVA